MPTTPRRRWRTSAAVTKRGDNNVTLIKLVRVAPIALCCFQSAPDSREHFRAKVISPVPSAVF